MSKSNKELALKINREIWNSQNFDLIPEFYTDDFVADYSPRIVRKGHAGLVEMVSQSHLTFEGFREEIRSIVADANSIAVHFTISGKQIGDWGPIPASHKRVRFDEIVIMSVRQGRVHHQVGVSDSLLALQQIGVLPDPGGFTKRSFEKD